MMTQKLMTSFTMSWAMRRIGPICGKMMGMKYKSRVNSVVSDTAAA